MSLKINVEEIQ